MQILIVIIIIATIIMIALVHQRISKKNHEYSIESEINYVGQNKIPHNNITNYPWMNPASSPVGNIPQYFPVNLPKHIKHTFNDIQKNMICSSAFETILTATYMMSDYIKQKKARFEIIENLVNANNAENFLITTMLLLLLKAEHYGAIKVNIIEKYKTAGPTSYPSHAMTRLRMFIVAILKNDKGLCNEILSLNEKHMDIDEKRICAGMQKTLLSFHEKGDMKGVMETIRYSEGLDNRSSYNINNYRIFKTLTEEEFFRKRINLTSKNKEKARSLMDGIESQVISGGYSYFTI